MKKLVAVFLALAFYSSTSFAACERPAPPALPNADTAVTAEMVKAQNEVKDYVAKAEAYLSCVDGKRSQNEMIAEMEKVAAEFNAVVRAYKARMANA